MGRTPLNARERLEAIGKYHILDTEYEQEYNDIVELASQVCQTPIAIITLLDDKRQWFKAQKGLDVRETEISLSFCAHMVKEEEFFIVNNADTDSRFRDNALVTSDPQIRFYAGIPLKMEDGIAIGSLAVIDNKPRTLSVDQLNALRILSRQAVQLLQLRLQNFDLTRRHTEKSNQIVEVLNRISDAFVAVDNEWKVTYMNQRAAQITQRKIDNVLGQTLWNEFPEAFSSVRFVELAQQSLLNQSEEYLEDFFQPYNMWMEAKMYPSATGLSIFFRDISQRKNAEKALKESEANYRKLIEGNPQPMWIYDALTLRILEVNEAAIKKYGYSREEFITLTIRDLRPESELERLKEFLQNNEVLTAGYTQSGPWKHRLKNGETIDVEVTSHEIFWQGKKARFTMAWDVTRRLEMENSLRVAEEKYRSIFENASEAIYQTTPDGKLITANPAMARIFGYKSPEELMQSVTDVGKQLYADSTKRIEIQHLLDDHGHVEGVELPLIRKNGQMIWTRSNMRVIKDELNKVLYYEGTIEDITQRKEAEEQLRSQFEELQKTNQELDRFVYSVSHDLRAPLATILGLIHVAELESPSATFNEYLRMIKTNIKRLDGFINDILDYSLNARKEVQVEEIQFHELIGEILKNFNFLPSADRLKVNLQIHASAPFYSDPYRVTIVLNNLLTNCIKYQDFNKENSFVSIHATASEREVVIQIEDNGIGIAKRHLDKIFNMFYRASENSKGSGLGLYIAKETVEKLRGKIRVQSELGLFTKFEVVLPNLQTL